MNNFSRESSGLGDHDAISTNQIVQLQTERRGRKKLNQAIFLPRKCAVTVSKDFKVFGTIKIPSRELGPIEVIHKIGVIMERRRPRRYVQEIDIGSAHLGQEGTEHLKIDVVIQEAIDKNIRDG
jgi:hypothetical protein